MMYIILGGLLYSYLGLCVWVALFDENDNLAGLLFTFFSCMIWPITLIGIGMFKFTRWLDKL